VTQDQRPVVPEERPEDRRHMGTALALARRGLGRVAPNPAVGCVLVKAGKVVGRGWTQPGGRPHAEAEALERAGEKAIGATAYVSLEPCAHHGQTPPCADAIVAAGIGRAVIAVKDPDPRVRGKGIAILRKAGVEVLEGLMEEEATAVNRGFFSRIVRKRPLVTLKLALSIDGRIATASGESQWITGAAARAHAHLLRAEHDAVLVGSGTAIADDPQLTVRLPGMEDRRPVRVVADGRLQLPLTHRLIASAQETPTWILTRKDCDKHRRRAFEEAGCEIIQLPVHENELLDLRGGLTGLAQRGITRVLVEGGGRLAASLLEAELVDRLMVFRGPLVIGGLGVPGISGLSAERLADLPGFRLVDSQTLGDDLMTLYERQPVPAAA